MENRLDEAASPYLQQHADNPVAWQPWDETALELAETRDVPVFLSVGYAACHWCHVMAEESFEDPAVAERLNGSFVPIKVDREERPDVDSVYMSVCQMVRGQGGWPLSVWLTPETEPFQVGTYFPPEPKQGMPAFGDLLEDIADSWSDPDERAEIEERAEQWADAVAGELEEVSDARGEAPDEEFVDAAASAAVRGADREHGGWGRGQKFPQPGRLHVLLRAFDRTGREEYRDVATTTLDAMVAGGLYDHVGGGFHRYCVDRDWTVPHFEKMLYDNAEIPRALLAGYQVTGDERYAEAVRGTFEFVERELTHPEGGFYSTLDAESEDAAGEREEGAFYVWTPETVENAIEDDTDAALFCDRYGVTEAGNFEHGTTVLTESTSLEELAEEYGLDTPALEKRLERAREQAFEAREERPRPPRDEKVLAGWNGLMVSAYAEAALVLNEGFATPAVEAVEFVREQLWDAETGTLQRRYKDGVTKIGGYLDDYAFLARGAFDLFQATRDVEYLAFAVDLARTIERDFFDEASGTLYYTPEGGESLIARPQELTDQSTPSSVGVAAELLDQLGHFTTDGRFGEVAEQVVETHGSRVRSNPLQHASLSLAADTVTDGPLELTLVADDPPENWTEQLRETYLGPRVLAWRPLDGETFETWLGELGLDEKPPIWEGRDQKTDKPTVYACRSFTCSPPRNELSTALGWADRMT